MADKPAEHPIGQLVQVFIIQGRGIVPLDAAVVLHPLKQQKSGLLQHLEGGFAVEGNPLFAQFNGTLIGEPAGVDHLVRLQCRAVAEVDAHEAQRELGDKQVFHPVIGVEGGLAGDDIISRIQRQGAQMVEEQAG